MLQAVQSPHASDAQSLKAILERQRAAFAAEGIASAATRKDRIQRLIDMLLLAADDLVEAMRLDFGHRSPVQSLMTDVRGILPSMQNDMASIAKWMKPQRVSSGPLGLFGTRSRIEWTPRGVIGIISPWNFPVGLAIQPLSQAFAAGNRGMIKVSEFTPRTGELLQHLIAQYFDEEEATVICGGPETGAAFSALPFDLMFFTGATGIARHVQRACADNLVPCILELGGKSPVIIGRDADLKLTAERIALGKTLNAGQICLAPDYVFVPQGKEQAFADAMIGVFGKMFGNLLENDDFTAVVNERHYARLRGHLDDARAKGATIIEFNPAGEDFSSAERHKLPPTLILGATPDMSVMNDEIFGPLLPVMPYRNIDEAIAFVNARPRPLATYYFGSEGDECRRYLDHTRSGGVCVNDVLVHVANEHLPFGGIGDSGMGTYHGRAGFEAMSYPRAIMRSGWLSPTKLMTPPYGPRMRKMLEWDLRRNQAAAARRVAKRNRKS